MIAAHPGSLPKEYQRQPFGLSLPKRLITLVLDAGWKGAEGFVAAAYNLACVLAIETVRQSQDGDWAAVAQKAAAIEMAIDGMVADQDVLTQIERKAHRGLVDASKRHADLVRLIADLLAIVRAQ